MARPIWNGSLSFGLVNVPVRLLSATEQKDVSFHQREAGSNSRVRTSASRRAPTARSSTRTW